MMGKTKSEPVEASVDSTRSGRVASKWDASAQDKVEHRPRKFARHSNVMRKALNELYTPEIQDKASYVKRTYFRDIEVQNALELGGGIGDFAIHVSRVMGCRNLTVYDLSEFSVDAGNKRAADEKLEIRFEQVDLNEFRLEEGQYDLIYASNSLHHVENLENLFEQVNRALTPEGLFFCIDYMGPDYMQWSDQQLDIMNRLLSVFPDRYARNSLRENVIDSTIRRIPLETFAKVDPSEGVRASSIIGIMEQNLRIVEHLPLGESLLYELMRGRIHNFDDDDDADAFVLRLLAVIEKILFDKGVIGSDFNFLIARKSAS